MKFCTACGSEIVSGAKFCGGCGAAVAAAPGGEAVAGPAQDAGAAHAPAPGQGAQATGWPTPTSEPTAGASTIQPAAAGGPGAGIRTQSIDWKTLPVAELVYPVAAVLLLVAVLVTDWYQSLGWYGADGEGPGALIILATLLAIVAALLGLPERLLPDQLKTLPLPLARLRQLLLVPLALAVLVALVKVLGGDEGMGPGVALASSGIILVALMGLPASALEHVRITAIACLGTSLLSILWPMRHLFPLNSMTTPLLLVALVTAALLGWLILGLVRRNFPDWAAMGFFGIIWILITLSDAGILARGVGSLPVLFLMAGVALAMAPGMMSLMRPPVERADRWLQTAAGFVTYGIFVAVLIFVIAVTTLSMLADLGVSEGRAELILLLLGSVVAAVACGYARSKLIDKPTLGRKVAIAVAAAGVVLAFLGAIGAEEELGGDSTSVLLVGLVAPAILAALVLAPPSVRARYGMPWGRTGEQDRLTTSG